jgi:DNA-binding NarL/FixJ family response regulator
MIEEAANGEEALDKIAKRPPDIVVLDLNLPGLSGLDVCRRVKSQHPNIKVIILSMHQDELYVFRALEAGASAYIVKEGAAQELNEAADAVAAGRMYISSFVSRAVLQSYVQRSVQTQVAKEPLLTAREQEVLQLVTTGLSSKEIAQRLDTSPRTIETHRHNLMKKLSIHTTPELIAYAMRNKLTV